MAWEGWSWQTSDRSDEWSSAPAQQGYGSSTAASSSSGHCGDAADAHSATAPHTHEDADAKLAAELQAAELGHSDDENDVEAQTRLEPWVAAPSDPPPPPPELESEVILCQKIWQCDLRCHKPWHPADSYRHNVEGMWVCSKCFARVVLEDEAKRMSAMHEARRRAAHLERWQEWVLRRIGVLVGDLWASWHWERTLDPADPEPVDFMPSPCL